MKGYAPEPQSDRLGASRQQPALEASEALDTSNAVGASCPDAGFGLQDGLRVVESHCQVVE